MRRNSISGSLDRPGFLPELHSLRGIGTVCIVLFHLSPVGGVPLPEELFFIRRYFGSAVILFIVLSGFSLYLTTSQKVGAGRWIKDFYIKRFFRIAPLFYFALVLNIAWAVLYWGAPVDPRVILIDISFIFNFFPGLHTSYVMAGWLIGVEAVFYAAFPALLIAVKGRPVRIAVVLALLTSASVAVSIWLAGIKDLSPGYRYMNFLTQSIGLGAGIGACYLFGSVSREWKARLSYPALAVGLIFFFIVSNPDLWGSYISPDAAKVPIYAFGFEMLALGMLFGAVPLLTNAVTVGLGELSYSIYLLHPLVLVLTNPFYKLISGRIAPLPAYLICASITFLVVVPISYVTYKLIEVKGMEFGRRLIAAGRP